MTSKCLVKINKAIDTLRLAHQPRRFKGAAHRPRMVRKGVLSLRHYA